MAKTPQADSRRSAKRNRFFFAWIALIATAFVLRGWNTWATADVPTVRHLIGDAASYFDWAQRIVAGDWLGSEGFYQAPLYPYFIAAVMSIVGSGVQSLRLAQCVLGVISVVSLSMAAARWFEMTDAPHAHWIGLLAGLMLAVYGPAIFYDGLIQKASLDCALSCLLLAAISQAESAPWSSPAIRLSGTSHPKTQPAGLTYKDRVDSTRRNSLDARSDCGPSARTVCLRFLPVGFILGLFCLVRENALVWLPVLLIWAAISTRARWTFLRSPATVSLIVGAAVALAPNAIRNRVVSGEWTLTTFQAGPNFYIGNHHGADGRYRPLVAGHESPEFERADAARLAEKEAGAPLTAKAVSRFWFQKTWDEIRAHPASWLRLLGYKWALVWNRYEISDAEGLIVHASHSPVLRVASYWHFGMLVPLAVLGIWIALFRAPRVWLHVAMILTLAASVAAFYVLGRYRFPLVPLLILYASAACLWAWQEIKERHWRRVGSGLVVAIVAGILVNRPIQDEARLDALCWMNAGVALARSNDIAGAEAYFRKCVDVFPSSPECAANLAVALALQGQFAQAVPFYRQALAANPQLPGVYYNLGVALERVGDVPAAIDAYAEALKQDPNDVQAAAALARLRGR